MKKIGIIGGGVAGLASAARLKNAGYEVTVFEKNDKMGGRMNTIEKDGYKFDLGPTIVMMPEVYQSVFSDCGKNPNDYIPMEQLSILYDLHFKNKKISVPSDLTLLHNLLNDIEKDIVSETVITPEDLKDKFNAKFGAAFGLRPTLKQSNFFRPQSTIKNINSLYFAGASNHPGAGVPIVLTSSEIVVKEIINDDK